MVEEEGGNGDEDEGEDGVVLFSNKVDEGSASGSGEGEGSGEEEEDSGDSGSGTCSSNNLS